ncbi:unnamed protein product [Victoria cruziana]
MKKKKKKEEKEKKKEEEEEEKEERGGGGEKYLRSSVYTFILRLAGIHSSSPSNMPAEDVLETRDAIIQLRELLAR